MRIAIDARMGHYRVGIGTYVRGLLKSLSIIDKDNDYYIIVNHDKNMDFLPSQVNFHPIYTNVKYSSYLTRDLWEHLYLPVILKRNKIDVYHGTNYVVPLFSNIPSVVTMFDMISFLNDSWYKPISRYRVQILIKASAKKASKIITGSLNSKKDIIDILKLPKEKVKHIYIGVDDKFRPLKEQDKLNFIKNRYNIKDKFILYVGSITPRKNLIRLIEAYSKLQPALIANYQLVIAGKRGWKSDEVINRVKDLKIEGRVRFTGFVDEGDLPYLINASELLVFPSLYEGFGIPPLEAMACGVPVAASNTSSIPEAVGDAALLFYPYNVEEMVLAISRVLVDENLKKDLISKGFERLKLFSWEEAAKETLEIYKEVYKGAK